MVTPLELDELGRAFHVPSMNQQAMAYQLGEVHKALDKLVNVMRREAAQNGNVALLDELATPLVQYAAWCRSYPFPPSDEPPR